jgi:hypothetical protein
MGQVTIRDALQHVAEHPEIRTDELIQLPVWELVGRNLYEIANHPEASIRGSMARANKARKMILDRLVGKRRAGSHPATRVAVSIDFVDLTGGGELGESSEGVQPPDGGDSGPGSADGEPRDAARVG